MPNSENSETEIPTQRLKLAQTTVKPTTQTQTQRQEPIQATLPTSQGKFLKIVLVTIVAFALTAALITAGLYLNKVQNIKKRDAKRKSDIKVIQEGLEIYRQDTLDAYYYPTAASPYTLEKGGYLAKFPQDPNNVSPYVYNYQPLPAGCIGNCTGYNLTACLENKNDKGENTTDPIPPCTTRSYKIVR